MEDDANERIAYETISGLQSIPTSLRASESSMRAYLMSGDDFDRKGYQVAWNLTQKQSSDIASSLPDMPDTARLYLDLRQAKEFTDKVVEQKNKDAVAVSQFNDRIDQDINQLLTGSLTNLSDVKEKRQLDFLLTEILFFITMGLGALSVLLAVYGVGRDIANHSEDSEDDENLGIDPVTQLLSRQAFESVLEEQLRKARKKRVPLTLVILELDQLDRIRELRGDGIFQLVRRGTSTILTDAFRLTDTVCSFSDTKFAIILPKTDLENSRVPAERARDAVLAHEWPDCYIAANIGVAQADEEEDKESLIERAEQAAEYARRTGRNRVSLRQAYASLSA